MGPMMDIIQVLGEQALSALLLSDHPDTEKKSSSSSTLRLDADNFEWDFLATF
jgi:hypothetical protein